jgi:lipid A 3-O-deacylase
MENFRDGEWEMKKMLFNQIKINYLILLKYLGFMFIFLLIFGLAYADGLDGVSISSGTGVCGIRPIRIGLQKHFNQHWCRSETDQWPITGYWELSFYHLKGRAGQKSGSHHKLNAITLAPVFRFQYIGDETWIFPYLEVGIGVSLFSQKEIGGRDLGMHFQFEDRCSLGMRFGYQQQYDIAYRVVHFSNAYLGPCNHGLNIHFLTLGYWFN